MKAGGTARRPWRRPSRPFSATMTTRCMRRSRSANRRECAWARPQTRPTAPAAAAAATKAGVEGTCAQYESLGASTSTAAVLGTGCVVADVSSASTIAHCSGSVVDRAILVCSCHTLPKPSQLSDLHATEGSTRGPPQSHVTEMRRYATLVSSTAARHPSAAAAATLRPAIRRTRSRARLWTGTISEPARWTMRATTAACCCVLRRTSAPTAACAPLETPSPDCLPSCCNTAASVKTHSAFRQG